MSSRTGFDSAADAIAAVQEEKGSTITQPKKKDFPPIPPVKQVLEKIELHYKYAGTGPDGRPVETIILDNIPRMAKDKVLAIAWSPSLKKEVASQVVPRIEQPEKE